MISGMLICIGGFPGSGVHYLADALSKKLNFHNFPLLELKQDPLLMQRHRVEENIYPGFSDKILLQIYKKAATYFRMTSKMYPDIIIRDYFAREIPREFLFKEAEKYFGPPVVIWAASTSEEEVQTLHEALHEKDQARLKVMLRLQSDIRARFEPFTRPVQEVRYVNNAAVIDEVLTLIRNHRGV